MPLYSPGENAINMLLQKLASYNRKVTALPGAASNINGVLTLNGVSYQSDGTNWLSTYLLSISLPLDINLTSNSFAATNTAAAAATRPHPTSNIWVESVTASLNNTGLADATNFWSLSAYRQDSAGTSTQIGTFTDHKVTGIALKTVTVGGLYSAANSYVFIVGLTKTGAPGNVALAPPTLVYRLAG